MARTKQTARRYRCWQDFNKLPKPKDSWEFNDHRGIPYTVLTPQGVQCRMHSNIPKLGVQLYSLANLQPSKEAVGKRFLNLHWHDMTRYPAPRVDVYPALGSIEECMEHHRREKEFRKQKAQASRQAAIEGLDEIATEIALTIKIRGKEPLPHIVPSYCCSRAFWSENTMSSSRYRSCIFVVPEECRSWGDIFEKGLLSVEFDQDLHPEMETEMYDCDPEDDTELFSEDGWVEIQLIRWAGPVHIRRVCVRHPNQYETSMAREDAIFGVSQTQGLTPGCDLSINTFWYSLMGDLPCGDAYRHIYVCENDLDKNCERDVDEHVADEDGQCVKCRRETEYRRRSRRIANRVSRLGG